MNADGQDTLLHYYEQELSYLRRMGGEFARKYPKVAARLELGSDQSADPYVERLLEGVAFLTARIQKNMAAEFPQITSALLDVLYPHFLNPIPSMAVAQFEVDPAQGKLTSGHIIDRHTPLFARSQQGHLCRFRTCYRLTLWPLEVETAEFVPTDHFDLLDSVPGVVSVLRLRIGGKEGELAGLELKRLRFYLSGEQTLAHTLYEMLLTDVIQVMILPDGGGHPVLLPDGSIQPVGFGADEEMLPYPGHAHPQYRLLQEYFAFPEKFLFIDIDNLDRHNSTTGFDILFLLRRGPKKGTTVNRTTFRLGCTPIINLFAKSTEPIRLTHRRSEYPLAPDVRRHGTTEIHSILSVSASSDAADETQAIEPFFSYNHYSHRDTSRAFWYARREHPERRDIPGTEMTLSLVDLDFNPASAPTQTVFAKTLCTNRHLAGQLPHGVLLQIEEAAPVQKIYCLNKPTRQIDSPLPGALYWRLISHLSLNFLSLSEGNESLNALREILGLYSAQDDRSAEQQIMGIRAMSCRRSVQRMGREAWRGFCQGTEVTLTFDEEFYVGSSAFLLASVLNRFFSLYSSINSFTQLVTRSVHREGDVHRWGPMVGEKTIL